jgi:hypothetical protein
MPKKQASNVVFEVAVSKVAEGASAVSDVGAVGGSVVAVLD